MRASWPAPRDVSVSRYDELDRAEYGCQRQRNVRGTSLRAGAMVPFGEFRQEAESSQFATAVTAFGRHSEAFGQFKPVT